MIPHLSTDEGLGGPPVEVPPPPWFRPLRGPPRNVRLNLPPGLLAGGIKDDATEAQKAGLRYEEKAQLYLSAALGPRYQQHPGLFFEDDSGLRVCIPDGLWLSGTVAVLFEIKISHMPEAWWQLRKLYSPVVHHLKGVEVVHCVEVCRSFDPSMPFPEPIFIVEDVRVMVENLQPDFGVVVWRPGC